MMIPQPLACSALTSGSSSPIVFRRCFARFSLDTLWKTSHPLCSNSHKVPATVSWHQQNKKWSEEGWNSKFAPLWNSSCVKPSGSGVVFRSSTTWSVSSRLNEYTVTSFLVLVLQAPHFEERPAVIWGCLVLATRLFPSRIRQRSQEPHFLWV